jgi:hypothetical protein
VDRAPKLAATPALYRRRPGFRASATVRATPDGGRRRKSGDERRTGIVWAMGHGCLGLDGTLANRYVGQHAVNQMRSSRGHGSATAGGEQRRRGLRSQHHSDIAAGRTPVWGRHSDRSGRSSGPSGRVEGHSAASCSMSGGREEAAGHDKRGLGRPTCELRGIGARALWGCEEAAPVGEA